MSQCKNYTSVLGLTFLLVSAWLIFPGCSVENPDKLAPFFSLISKDDADGVDQFIENLGQTEKEKHLKLLCFSDRDLVESRFKDQCDCKKLIEDFARREYTSIEHDTLGMAYQLFNLENLVSQDLLTSPDISNLDDLKWDQSSKYNLLLQIRYLTIKARIYSTISSTEKCKLYLDYALFLINKHDLKSFYPRESAFLYLLLAKYFIEEGEYTNVLYAANESLHISREFGFKDLEYRARYFIIDFGEENPAARLSKLQKLIQDEEVSQEIRLQLFDAILSGLSIEDNRKYFEYVVSEIEAHYNEATCDKFENNFYITVAYNYVNNNELEKASEYFDKVKLDDRCNDTHRLWSEFYFNSEIPYFYEGKYSETGNIEYLDRAVFHFKEQLYQMPILFEDVMTKHFDHSFMLNSFLFLELVSNYPIIPDRIKEDLLTYIYNAKGQELKIDRMLTSKSSFAMKGQIGSINRRLGEYEIKLKKLKNSDYYKSELIENKFNEVLKRDLQLSEIDKISQEGETQEINLNEVISYLRKNNTQIIEYVEYDDNLIAYQLTADEMKIAHLDKTAIDSLVNVCIENPEAITMLSDYRFLFIPFKLQESLDNIILLKDGILHRFSFDLLGLDQNIYYHHDLLEVLNEKPLRISNDSIQLLCFTDDKTFEDSRIKDHEELYFGFESISNIEKLLKCRKDNLTTGWDFTYKSFLEATKSPAIHVITHAIGDDDIQNNGKMIFRNNRNQYDSISTNTLDFMEDYPAFVYLDACQTGIGKNFVGEGNYSIDRVFLKNGTSTVIKTLWPILDETSGFFAIKYYENWLAGMSSSEALRQAKNQVKLQYPNPYHWAPFVLEGNPNVYLSKN